MIRYYKSLVAVKGFYDEDECRIEACAVIGWNKITDRHHYTTFEVVNFRTQIDEMPKVGQVNRDDTYEHVRDLSRTFHRSIQIAGEDVRQWMRRQVRSGYAQIHRSDYALVENCEYVDSDSTGVVRGVMTPRSRDFDYRELAVMNSELHRITSGLVHANKYPPRDWVWSRHSTKMVAGKRGRMSHMSRHLMPISNSPQLVCLHGHYGQRHRQQVTTIRIDNIGGFEPYKLVKAKGLASSWLLDTEVTMGFFEHLVDARTALFAEAQRMLSTLLWVDITCAGYLSWVQNTPGKTPLTWLEVLDKIDTSRLVGVSEISTGMIQTHNKSFRHQITAAQESGNDPTQIRSNRHVVL